MAPVVQGQIKALQEPVLVRFNDQGLQPAVRRVATGGEHVCAELLDRSLYCWGREFRGAIRGYDQLARRLTPTIVGAFSHLVDFNLGLYTCVVNRTTEGEEFEDGSLRRLGLVWAGSVMA